jgi:sigma-B regulation protein RsbU (phosphoserine phosphatase)
MKRVRRIARQKLRAFERLTRRLRARLSVLRVLSLLEALSLCGALIWALTRGRLILFSTLGSHADVWAMMTALILLGLLHALVNRRVAVAFERRFSSEAYDERRILFDLGQAARAVTTIDELFRLVVAQIEEALHTANVSIFVRDDATGDYVCRISSGQPTGESYRSALESRRTQQLTLAHDAFIVKRLHHLSAPLGVEQREFETWSRALVNAPARLREARQRERETLELLQSRLLLQVMMRNELIGIISLGPRASGRPFSSDDKQMLRAVAGQMAFIIEHSKLVGRIVEEERLRRELALATEVQQRLFPDAPPASEALELSGFCQPAREVGGDYYDFLRLDNGQIGVAIADVAGKGIAAALLMSIIQASLRSQAVAQSQITGISNSLAELAGVMNRLLWRSTSASSYVTFFYAQFDEASRQLTCVNAGHNPPLLLRAGNARRADALMSVGGARAEMLAPDDGQAAAETEWTTLAAGGMALGLFDKSRYEQETIEMRCGDLLLAYTDGVTEALNTEGEEFGEARLKELLASCAHLSAEEVRARLVHRVRAWCQGAPQHDDLTFVVFKVK